MNHVNAFAYFVCWKSRSAQKYCVCSLRSWWRDREKKKWKIFCGFLILLFYISTFIFLQQRKHTSFTRESSWSLFIGFFSSVCMCERCRMQFIKRELSSCGRAVRMNESGGKSAFLLPPLADLLLLLFFFAEWSSTTRARIATKAARLSSCLTQIKTLHKLQFFVFFSLLVMLLKINQQTSTAVVIAFKLSFSFHLIHICDCTSIIYNIFIYSRSIVIAIATEKEESELTKGKISVRKII